LGEARHDDARGGRNGEAGHLGNGLGGFTYRLGIYGAIRMEEQVAQRRCLAFIGEISPFRYHQIFQLRRDWLISNDGLLGGADGGAVKGLAADDVLGGFAQVRTAVHISGHVARPHTVSGFADGMGGLNHNAATGG